MICFEIPHPDEKKRITSALLVVMLLLLLWGGFSQAAGLRAGRVAILISRDIRPYVEAVEGMSAVFEETPGIDLEVWSLDKFPDKSRVTLAATLREEKADLFLSVGPEAARFIWMNTLPEGAERIYSIVLNPDQVLDGFSSPCGVCLNIPVQTQIDMIGRGLPGVSRIGILYDPRYNDDFFEEASRVVPEGKTVVPLAISSKKEIPVVLQQHWGDVDALWLIPDRTVISESIIAYVIKESLFKKVPVIGYNRFFYDSGSAFAFVFDYEELGRQCAREALTLLSGGDCRQAPPLFHVWINTRVMKKLGFTIAEEYPFPIEVGP